MVLFKLWLDKVALEKVFYVKLKFTIANGTVSAFSWYKMSASPQQQNQWVHVVPDLPVVDLDQYN